MAESGARGPTSDTGYAKHSTRCQITQPGCKDDGVDSTPASGIAVSESAMVADEHESIDRATEALSVFSTKRMLSTNGT